MKNFFFISFYRYFLWPLFYCVFRLLSLTNAKIRSGFLLRKDRPWRQCPWKTNEPSIWIHCASGEFEYAKPVIREIKKRSPATKVVVTYFSPSVRQSVMSFPGVDLAVPAPWDTPRAIGEFLHAFRPMCLLIARTDLWPEMLYQCHLRKIPSLLFAATLTVKSGRMRPGLRYFFKWVTGLLTRVLCVSEADQKVFLKLISAQEIAIGGDTRYEQVLVRLQNPKKIRTEIKPKTTALIAGSTWPEDEKVLLPAIQKLPIFMVLVPHEPTPTHVETLKRQLADLDLSYALYSQANLNANCKVLIVDQVGILAELYQWGDLAFVGGSFKKTVHSVMEPLAAGCITLVGPKHSNNREALEFQSVRLKAQPNLQPVYCVRDATEMQTKITELLPVLAKGEVQGEIQQQIQSRAHATELVLDWLSPFLTKSKTL